MLKVINNFCETETKKQKERRKFEKQSIKNS